MRESKDIAKATQNIFTSKIADIILGVDPVMARMLKNAPKVHFTWRDELFFKLRPIKWYFKLLVEAITNTHRCPTDD